MKPFSSTGIGWARRFQCHDGPVLSMALSPDGKTLATGGEDGYLRFWSTEGQNLLRAMDLTYEHRKLHHPDEWVNRYGDVVTRDTLSGAVPPSAVRAVRWSPSGRRIAVAVGLTVFVIGATGGTVLRRLGPQGGVVMDLDWCGRHDSHVVAVSTDRAVTTWRAIRGEHSTRADRSIPINHHFGLPLCLALNPNGDGGWVGTGAGGLVYRDYFSVATDVKWVRNSCCGGVGVDGESYYVGDGYGYLYVVDRNGNDLTPVFRMHEDGFRCMAKPFSSSLAASGSVGGEIKCWSEKLGPFGTFEGHCGAVTCLAVPPSFEFVCSGGEDGTVRLWADARSGLRKLRARLGTDRPATAPEEGARHLDI